MAIQRLDLLLADSERRMQDGEVELGDEVDTVIERHSPTSVTFVDAGDLSSSMSIGLSPTGDRTTVLLTSVQPKYRGFRLPKRLLEISEETLLAVAEEWFSADEPDPLREEREEEARLAADRAEASALVTADLANDPAFVRRTSSRRTAAIVMGIAAAALIVATVVFTVRHNQLGDRIDTEGVDIEAVVLDNDDYDDHQDAVLFGYTLDGRERIYPLEVAEQDYEVGDVVTMRMLGDAEAFRVEGELFASGQEDIAIFTGFGAVGLLVTAVVLGRRSRHERRALVEDRRLAVPVDLIAPDHRNPRLLFVQLSDGDIRVLFQRFGLKASSSFSPNPVESGGLIIVGEGKKAFAISRSGDLWSLRRTRFSIRERFWRRKLDREGQTPQDFGIILI